MYVCKHKKIVEMDTEFAHIEGRKRKRNKKRFVLAASVWNKDTKSTLWA